jgi:hypothetical protein
MKRTLEEPARDLQPLMDAILEEIPAPAYDEGSPLQYLVSNIDYDDYVGRIAVGRVFNGALAEGQSVLLVKHHGGQVVNVVKQLFVYRSGASAPSGSRPATSPPSWASRTSRSATRSPTRTRPARSRPSRSSRRRSR